MFQIQSDTYAKHVNYPKLGVHIAASLWESSHPTNPVWDTKPRSDGWSTLTRSTAAQLRGDLWIMYSKTGSCFWNWCRKGTRSRWGHVVSPESPSLGDGSNCPAQLDSFAILPKLQLTERRRQELEFDLDECLSDRVDRDRPNFRKPVNGWLRSSPLDDIGRKLSL